MKLIVQIPCFNEAQTLPEVLADIPRSIEGVDEIEVLVIDDGSSDDTARVAREHGAQHVVRHRGNRGLAQAFLTGIETALGLGADIIVNTDGDHQYPGKFIPQLVEPVVKGETDLVIGDRQTQSDPRVPWIKKLFYRLGNSVVRIATGVSVQDAPSGFRAMSRDFALSAYLTNPFSYTLETIFTAAENRQPIDEVAIETNPVQRKSRLFKGIPDYVNRSYKIIVQGYSMRNPLKAFGWLSAPFFLAGIGIGMRFLYIWMGETGYTGHIQSLILAAVCVLVGAQIFLFGILGNLVRTNRLLLQDIRLRVRRLELGRGTGAAPADRRSEPPPPGA
jgi:glycosyltransferase involved in cell wall biosynthesis